VLLRCDELPSWAMDAGADVCVTSIHKMGGGLEQGSVYHLQGDLVDATVLQARADLLGTTSPSVLIYAGLDGWRRQMVQHGTALLDDALRLAAGVRAEIDAMEGMHVHGPDDFVGPHRAAGLDPLQTVIDISALPMNGYQAVDWLRQTHHIDLHTADHRRINAQLTYADDAETAGKLLDGLRDLVRHADDFADDFPEPPKVRVPQPDELAL
jgi:arginine decarboxylase